MMEWIAVAAGIVAVYLATRQHVATWPIGLVSVALYVYIFLDAKLYSDMILHVFYVGVQLYGWWTWRGGTARGGAGRRVLPVSNLARRPLLALITGTLLGSILWGWAMNTWTDAALPWADAFTTVASFVAQFLMAHKKIEHWIFWIVIDTVAVAVYILRDLHLTAGLYAVYLVLAVIGYRAWRRMSLQ
ncbi:MAG: aminotransferase [Bacteroidetes bacterium CG12_big_fil_rev_8_21_14_0_65_60_17]|nr:MAG: aminotransferase [Bacteroidetes bacterium CG12_big_fil_rev_8_21_14_0_65_60_17]